MSGGSGKSSDKSGDSSGGRKTPAAGTSAREKLPTLTDARELEEARRKSLAEMPSAPPQQGGAGAKKHPSNPLGLVNTNVPSVPPAAAPPPQTFSLPKAPPQLVLDEFNDLDRGWGEEHSAESAPATTRVNVPEVAAHPVKKEPEKPALKEPAKKPPPLPSKAGPRTISSRKIKAVAPPPAPIATPVALPAQQARAPQPPRKASSSPVLPPRIVVPPPIAMGAPFNPTSVVPPAPPTRPTPLGLAAPMESLSFDDDDEVTKPAPKENTSNAPTAPPPADIPTNTPSQRDAMKAYPSARSLVSEVDADAMVSTLFDDGPSSTPAVTAVAPPLREVPREERKEEPKEERKEKETAPAPLPGASKSPLASTLNSSSGPLLPSEKSGAKSEEEGAREMRDRYSLGDYTGALEIAEKLTAQDANDQEALDMAQNCRATLEQMYTTRIGPLDRVPVVMVPSEQLRWLSIDHRAGFVLSNIDGVSSLEMIIDVSGMTTLDALRILCELAQQRIISFR